MFYGSYLAEVFLKRPPSSAYIRLSLVNAAITQSVYYMNVTVRNIRPGKSPKLKTLKRVIVYSSGFGLNLCTHYRTATM